MKLLLNDIVHQETLTVSMPDELEIEQATLLYKYVLANVYEKLPLSAKLVVQALVRAKLDTVVKFKHGEDPVYTATETLVKELPLALKDASISISTSSNNNTLTATHITVQLQGEGKSR